MKPEDYLLAERFASMHDLCNPSRDIDPEKVREFVKNCPEILRVLLAYLKEADATEIKVNEAVLSKDGNKLLVRRVIWDPILDENAKMQEVRPLKVVSVDVQGNVRTESISDLKRLK